jgi:hypothetical protein
VLLSETIDGRSRATLEDSVRALNDTNTAIYTFGFSSAKAAVSHEATKPKRPGGSSYHGDLYAAGGCISRTASCAFSVVPDGTGFWAEIQFPGLRPGLLSVVPAGLGSACLSVPGLRPGFPGRSWTGLGSACLSSPGLTFLDCVLGY